ncbi:calcium-binding and coiled-coil domain-containing protein 2 [Cololabis saira]|uniref:calcium-binding and coiled-coil domain-containing protein 2 n=1 Tax=Cololabis saira TaxID=129043 RepID=UPI002AD3D64D|nr:calcium-binding and coiled-coil domain-containing protein 2 [Cololabis saira]
MSTSHPYVVGKTSVRGAPERTTGLFLSRARWSSRLPQSSTILQLGMDGVTEAADPSARTYSQVVFLDIPHSYPPATPITCRYTLSAAFTPQSRDWVGIFKVGWTTTKEYHTFVWAEPSQHVEGQQTMTTHAVFKEYYLPRDEAEFYQLCYIDGGGQVRGASTPFCFRSAAEPSSESMDDDLLVITTQEQVDQSHREKGELQKELQLLRDDNEALRSALQKEQKETTSFKEQNEQRGTEATNLLRDMDQLREEKEQLKKALQLQQEENDRLKEEMVIQMTKEMELRQHNATEQEKQSQSSKLLKGSEEKYDRALTKINQLKEEREELKKKTEGQSEEIERLKAKLREGEQELLKSADSIPLLQIDLQNSEKEKEGLVAELQRLQSLADGMDEVKKENRELCRRLSQQETVQVSPQDNLKVQSLGRQLQETQMNLAAEKEESSSLRRGAETLERELQHVSEQLASLVKSYDHEQRKSSKLELQLGEMNEAMADKSILIEEKEQEMMLMTQETEQLARENKVLRDDIEGLRKVCANNTSFTELEYVQPDILPPGGDTAAAGHGAETENIGGVEELRDESLVCRHCQECFPGITRSELEQHEQSHRVCPFCTVICDHMEQSVFEDHVYGHEL